MRFHYSAAALALITKAALAEECPAGYFKSKKLVWRSCGDGTSNPSLECASLHVPLDWKNAETSEKLKLQLIRQPSSNPLAKSIIVNPGGPGESGIETIVDGGAGYQR